MTSGTIFASRKLSFTDLLAAIVIFVNGAKGVAALQLSRGLDCQYKTAFVLTHKLREAMARENATRQLNGIVELDGAYFGSYVKSENRAEDRKDRRLKANRSGKRQCVVIMRERNGRSLPFVVANEGDAVPYVRDHVGTLATIYADEGTGWDALHAGWDARRVNHSVAFMDEGVCTNQAESYFSRLRRAEIGTITSPARTSTNTPGKCHGARITDASATGIRRRLWRVRQWLRARAGHGRGTGSTPHKQRGPAMNRASPFAFDQ